MSGDTSDLESRPHSFVGLDQDQLGLDIDTWPLPAQIRLGHPLKTHWHHETASYLFFLGFEDSMTSVYLGNCCVWTQYVCVCAYVCVCIYCVCMFTSVCVCVWVCVYPGWWNRLLSIFQPCYCTYDFAVFLLQSNHQEIVFRSTYDAHTLPVVIMKVSDR